MEPGQMCKTVFCVVPLNNTCSLMSLMSDEYFLVVWVPSNDSRPTQILLEMHCIATVQCQLSTIKWNTTNFFWFLWCNFFLHSPHRHKVSRCNSFFFSRRIVLLNVIYFIFAEFFRIYKLEDLKAFACITIL